MATGRVVATSILLAVWSLLAWSLLACLADDAADAAEAACAAKAVTTARKAAQARRTAGDPAGAWTILHPFVALDCLAEAAKTPTGPDRKALSDYAWLVNDAYVNGADRRFGPGAPEQKACIELLRPLANDDLVPRPWMSAALRQASVANIKACAAGCGPSLDCVPFRATAWSTYTSEARTFRKHACTSGHGQRLDDGRCLELRGKAGVGFAWSDQIKTELPTPEDERAFCPAVYLRVPGRKDVARLEAPETSALRDGSFCCAALDLEIKPGTDEFVIVGDDVRDCNGGTAKRMIEEIYRLPPGATVPVLARDNSLGLH